MSEIDYAEVWAKADLASRKAYLVMYGAPHSEGHKQAVVDAIGHVAFALGYTLTPIVTPSPDSGRAKEIGDVFQNHGA